MGQIEYSKDASLEEVKEETNVVEETVTITKKEYEDLLEIQEKYKLISE